MGLVEVTPEGAARFAVFGGVECASWNFEGVELQRQGAVGDAQLRFDSPGCLVTPPPIDNFYFEFDLFDHGEDLDFRRVVRELGLVGFLEGELTVTSNRTEEVSSQFDTRFWWEPLSQGLPPDEEPLLFFRLHLPHPPSILSSDIEPINLRDLRHTLYLGFTPGGPEVLDLSIPNPGVGEHEIVARVGELTAARRIVVSDAGGGTTCTPTDTTHCLNRGRFRVTAEWRDFEGEEGPAHTRSLSADSGLFWFFDENNVELMVKILDGCSTPFDAYWVFASGLTNVAVDLTVTDSLSGEVWHHSTELHEEFGPILDTRALEVCP